MIFDVTDRHRYGILGRDVSIRRGVENAWFCSVNVQPNGSIYIFVNFVARYSRTLTISPSARADVNCTRRDETRGERPESRVERKTRISESRDRNTICSGARSTRVIKSCRSPGRSALSRIPLSSVFRRAPFAMPEKLKRANSKKRYARTHQRSL